MRSNWLSGARRAAGLAFVSLAIASLAAGCGNNGGAGDGAVDNGDSLPGGASAVAGNNGNRAGSANMPGAAGSGVAGTVGTSGGAGASGGAAGGASGGAAGGGGASGNAGHGGVSGSAGSGGKAGNGGAAGVSGSASGGMSTTGGGGSGGASCVSTTCGNGTVEGCEACDDGPAFIGGSGGTAGAPGGAGSGGGSGTEGNGGAGGTPSATYGTLCSSDCNYKISTPECLTCLADTDCPISEQNCTFPPDASGLGHTIFTPQQSVLCFSVMRCIQTSNCMDGSGTPGKCYCGTLATTPCGAAPFDLTQPGAPNGACAAVIQAGMTGLTSNSAILAAVGAVSKPSGAAMQLLNCQKTNDDNHCQAACGFSTASLPPF